jgi:hypothetical protein
VRVLQKAKHRRIYISEWHPETRPVDAVSKYTCALQTGRQSEAGGSSFNLYLSIAARLEQPATIVSLSNARSQSNAGH